MKTRYLGMIGALAVSFFAACAAPAAAQAVKGDQLPCVEIVEPKESSKEDRTPIASFDIAALARDDHGIQAAQLVVDRVRREPTTDSAVPANPAGAAKPAAPSHWEIDLVTPPQNGGPSLAAAGATFEPAERTPDLRSFAIGYHWDLAALQNADLKPGDVLEYYIKVKDDFLLDGKTHPWVKSGKVTVTIISMEEFTRRMQIRAAEIKREISHPAAGDDTVVPKHKSH